MNKILNIIPDCIIDKDGVFKYVQILVKSLSTHETKYVVRGYAKYDYHAKNFADFKSTLLINTFNLGELNKLGVFKDVSIKCIGGGRIQIDKLKKTIFVYGYSKSMQLSNYFF